MPRSVAVRVYTHLAPPGLTLASPTASADGALLFGRGTALSPRHLLALIEEGVAEIEVEPSAAQPEVPPWIQVAPPEETHRALEARFERVAGDRRMMALKKALAAVIEAGL